MKIKVIILYSLFCVISITSDAQINEQHPNILFIAIDDLKPTIGSFGDSFAQTPVMDALSSEATVFLNNHTQQAVCGRISSQLTDTNLCDNVTTPALVISKINYNPLVDASLDSSDFEFIEIKNNSTSTIDLTGIYFGGLGFVYQFADGQTLSGETAIFLSNESDSFNDRYGFEPFGEFSRSLSNDGEDLILRDAYGNIIDEVTYNDVLPWPVDADGAGSFLKLVSVDLDNSLASSWVAVNDTTDNLSVNSVQFESFVSLFPNPVSDKLKIKISKGKISSLKLWSLNGKLFDTYKYNNQNVELDLSDFENGLYLLQIQTTSELLFKKIIKN